MVCARSFWREQGLSGSAFVTHEQAVLAEIRDACDAAGDAAALIGFLALSPGQRRDFAEGLPMLIASQFTQLFGDDADGRRHYYQDWACEAFTCAVADLAQAPSDHPQLVRLRAIGQRIVPFAMECNPRAQKWQWEFNLVGSNQINAFCMPGGKIAFYWGILRQLQLSDDEVAMIMGHEMAHALREHARERMGKSSATRLGANLISSLLGLGQLGDAALGMGAQLLTLKFSREDESEADLVGLDLAARAGYDPRAGVSLWQKMQIGRAHV